MKIQAIIMNTILAVALRQPFILTVLFVAFLVAQTGDCASIYKRHNTNFFCFSKNNELFFPVGANTSPLMDPMYPEKMIPFLLHSWAEAGINTVRICVDDYQPGKGLYPQFENEDGTLKAPVIERIQLILAAAKENNLAVVLVFFDTASMAQNWKEHGYNKSNKGPCAEIADFFTSPQMLGRATKRIKQLVETCNSEDILAWEMARGINIWEMGIKVGTETSLNVEFWSFRMTDTLRRADQMNHLVAFSYVPNTLPLTFMAVGYVDVNFLHIRGSDPHTVAASMPPLLEIARDHKKPVFIAEISSPKAPQHRAEITRNVFWSSLALCSGSFLSPLPLKDGGKITGEDLALAKNAQPFLDFLDLDGVPRPASRVPIEINTKGRYQLVEGMQGRDWIFWLLRPDAGEETPNLTFRTVEGEYLYRWFDTETGEAHDAKQFLLIRKYVTLAVPPFGHDTLGVLRLLRAAPSQRQNKTPGSK
jgi:hypothetical protein